MHFLKNGDFSDAWVVFNDGYYCFLLVIIVFLLISLWAMFVYVRNTSQDGNFLG